MSPQVSILVPIYNVSGYIERCAHSLFQQTFQDAEYVFVDDCTPDDSMEKLTKVMTLYPEREKQVTVIRHPCNRGLASARNTAIDNSSGKYLLQIDSDDYVEPDMVELLYNKAEEAQADIVVCDFFDEQEDKRKVVTDLVCGDVSQNRSNVIISSQSVACVWNKLIKRELYNRCSRLPNGLNYGEDKYMVVQLYFLTDRITKVDKPLYHHITDNNTSITAQKRGRKHFENTFECWDFLTGFLEEQGASETHRNLLALEKVKRKASLMIATDSCSLRKEYAQVWRKEEAHCFSQLKRGKKTMTILLRYRLFVLAQLYHYGVVLLHRFMK